MFTGAESHVHKHKTGSPGEEIVDGPQPMRDLKPCKTTPNSADQFEESHQAEYEARDKRSADHVQQVHDHNATYPALRNEIERRRSITKVTAGNARRRINHDSVCQTCLRRNRRITKKYISKPKYQRKRINQNKPKSSKCRRPDLRNKCRFRKRACPCRFPATATSTVKKTNLRESRKPYVDKKILSTARNEYLNDTWKSRVMAQSDPLNKNVSRSDVGSLDSPTTAEPSLSSYSSFLSMDHEPMDN